MSSIVELNNITKRYSNKVVLSTISLTINQGQTLILLGTNGSGKSTLIRIIGGFIHPTTGHRIVNNSQQPKIGFMPDRFPKHKFTSQEYLIHMGCIQGLKKDYLHQRIKELHSLFHLQLSDQPMRYFSKGMLQKVNMMQSILSRPDLLLLDEPLSGLDVSSSLEMISALQELKKQGVTIVISTHEPAMLQRITDRIVTVKDASLFEHEEQQVFNEGASLVICRFKDMSLANQFSSHIGVISSSTANSLTSFYVHEDSCDTLLLEILQAGGSIINIDRKGV
ncbi:MULTISPECIES: ATP-binding cassette domain-containing protein [Paenibacillus]|uniref:ABC transporter ATP-binding protein n=1 Tax=Paenibacillus cucumis (ex Kampfer et al. 2016) TaxID=1776858 RepID=A0ABS7KSH7_9BACL|nr:ABC transporter ATP-binding protein [Paenibacillus cucumis (ex Kampfer et al. 2016)]MBY0207122.1 ABC transporter ATP-binding protein [Paenibacillus cucumis (ex Kampfer et al. 2016)]MDP9698977.1 ABC-type multidrug transport system ATPase subunit [Paenibacillus intestini]